MTFYYSFGMLMWELSYQKFPYSNMKSNDIITHVTNGNREVCLNLENEVIHKSLLNIIQHSRFL
ncbi:hypothetical protein C2G38_2083658, partial [Gigaspora rosea]